MTRLTEIVGEAVATSWFSKAMLGDITDGTATVIVSTRFVRSWLSARYDRATQEAIAAVYPGVTRVQFEVGEITAVGAA